MPYSEKYYRHRLVVASPTSVQKRSVAYAQGTRRRVVPGCISLSLSRLPGTTILDLSTAVPPYAVLLLPHAVLGLSTAVLARYYYYHTRYSVSVPSIADAYPSLSPYRASRRHIAAHAGCM
eukprot:2924326-Rhodomonas_salina.1